jgi:predicted RNA binding protein YcfA (HicA-like mRNA interferase family)
MSKREKLLRRLLSKPKDFTFDEAVTLLRQLGYELDNKGKTSGSAVSFVSNQKHTITIHKPHPGNILKSYQVKHIIEELKNAEII